MLPGVSDQMEGCPADSGLNLLYLCLSGLLGVFLFIVIMGCLTLYRSTQKKKNNKKRAALKDNQEFIDLQMFLYGEKQLRKLLRADSSTSIGNTMHSDIEV